MEKYYFVVFLAISFTIISSLTFNYSSAVKEMTLDNDFQFVPFQVIDEDGRINISGFSPPS
jgi:hypothetical protein